MSAREEDLLLAGACTLDHDGCVVCSDAGILVRIVSLAGDDALCEDAAGNQAQIAAEFVAPVGIGDILLTHGGVAIGKVPSRTAQPTLADVGEGRRAAATTSSPSPSKGEGVGG